MAFEIASANLVVELGVTPFLRERLLQGARTQAHRGLDGGARRDWTCPYGKPVGIWCLHSH